MHLVKVPYLKPLDIENSALELLALYGGWRGSRVEPPVDVDEIAEGYLELSLELDDLRTRLGIADVLGATWFDDMLIRIDRHLEGNEGRFAFTLAHEIGHWRLHRPLFELQKLVLSLFPPREGAAATPAFVCRTGERKAPAEWQADRFAACLLMPSHAMRTTGQRILGDQTIAAVEGLDQSRSAGQLPQQMRRLAGEFIAHGNFTNVSNEAMCYRLLDLGMVEDVLSHRERLF
jgi:Zn-dependent peptidase ImmA (M78 family)